MTFTPGSELNEDDLTQEDIDEYNKRRKEEYDDANNPQDPNDLEEELKKRDPDPSQGVARQDYSFEALLLASKLPKLKLPELPAALGIAGRFLKSLRGKDKVLQLQNDEQPLLKEQTFGTESNYLTRIFGEVTPQGVEYLKTLMMRKKGEPSSNEKIKQSLLKDEQIELPATYKGGPKTFREKADFFDVSAAIIGGGKEDMIDPETGEFYEYDRLASTEFGKSQKNKHRNIIFEHIKKNIGAKNITREEFDRYADEQSAAETDLRNAIRLLNLKSYAANRYVDLTPYDTKEKQLKLLGEINKAKRPPTRRKDKDTGEFTEDAESFEARTKIWELETAPFQQYTDYKETFDYGHIISAKTGFRTGDVGMNRISNTEIEAAHNIVSRDPRTQKIIEILQEGNRERGARRDYLPSVQMMRNTSATVVEDFVKWQSSQPGAEGPNLTAILDKFMPREQHDNYLKYIQKRFNEKRSLSGSLKQFLENEIGIPYEDYVKFPNRLKLKAKALYEKDKKQSGNVIGKQQYAQGTKWMREAADAFIQLHHFDKNKRLRTTKEDTQLQDIDDTPKTFQDLLDILNQE